MMRFAKKSLQVYSIIANPTISPWKDAIARIPTTARDPYLNNNPRVPILPLELWDIHETRTN